MSYEFKNLKEQEIIEFLRDINFDIHDNKALHRPDSNFVVDVLSTCATRCLSRKKDDLAKINFQGLSKINNDSHADAIQFMNHFYCIKELMDILNVQDFSLLDIIDPQPKRIKYFLSVVISYMRLRDREEAGCKEYILRNKELEERLSSKRSQYEKDRADHDALIEKKNIEMPAIQEKKQQIEMISDEIRLGKEILTGVQNEEDVIMKERQVLDAQVDEIREKIDLIRQELEQLIRRVVKSPEKIIDSLNEINREVKHEKETISELDEEIKKLNLRLEIYSFLQQSLDECFRMMEDTSASLSSERNIKKKLKDIQRDSAILKDQLDEKHKELQNTMRDIKSNEERADSTEVQLQKRLEQINSMLNQLTKERNNLQKESDEVQSTVKSMEKMRIDVENKAREVTQANEGMVKEFSEIYDGILETLNNLHGDLSYLFDTHKPNAKNSQKDGPVYIREG